MPKVSIILPFKNSSRTIRDCINSILRQNLIHWELIAIDDHSTDSSFSILKTLRKGDKRITILKNPGDGIVDSLNFGIKKANTQLIARMDADDIMHPKAAQIAGFTTLDIPFWEFGIGWGACVGKLC